mgnify:CR=1 FL=1
MIFTMQYHVSIELDIECYKQKQNFGCIMSGCGYYRQLLSLNPLLRLHFKHILHEGLLLLPFLPVLTIDFGEKRLHVFRGTNQLYIFNYTLREEALSFVTRCRAEVGDAFLCDLDPLLHEVATLKGRVSVNDT